MILVVLAIGIVLLVSSLRGTHVALFTALGQDVPHFVVWAAAILALGALGFIPTLKPISRGLMALVLVVIVFTNYKGILAGFQSVSTAPAATGSSGTTATPAAANSNSTVPNYGALDYVTPPSTFSSSSVGH